MVINTLIDEKVNNFLFTTQQTFIEQEIERFLNNEQVNWDLLYEDVKSLSNKKGLFKKYFEKLKTVSDSKVKKHYLRLLIILATSITPTKLHNTYAESVDNVLNKLNYNTNPDVQDLLVYIKNDFSYKFKDINMLSISPEGIEAIKKYEALSLKAYELGDENVSIGYGHAEPYDQSKYQVGDSITIQEAEKLFIEDLKEAEDGVKRILNKWNSAGADIKVTQSMYDAMVSIAFNQGIQGLVSSKFMQILKKTKNPIKASHYILKSRVGSETGENTPNTIGLKKRRVGEYNMFISEL